LTDVDPPYAILKMESVPHNAQIVNSFFSLSHCYATLVWYVVLLLSFLCRYSKLCWTYEHSNWT